MQAGRRHIDEEHGRPAALDAASIDAVARRVVELLTANGVPTEGLMSAAEVARRFGISRSTVYERAQELGAIRLGDGPKARLRFDPQTVAEWLTVTEERKDASEKESPGGRNRRRGPVRPADGVPLLQIRGRSRA
ncbi:MAG: helix-turn-helix domain-containing protein [Solirubrobacterales bacterium]